MKAFIATFITLLLISVSVPFARAWACCDPWGWVAHGAFIQAGQQIVSSITNATNQISGLLEKALYRPLEIGFGKLYQELTKQSALQRSFKQGVIASRAQLNMQQLIHRAAQRATLPAELSRSVTDAALLAEQDAVVVQQIGRNNAGFSQSFYSTKPFDPATMMIEQHRAYCSGDEQASGRCDSLVPLALQNADLTLNTIVNPGAAEYQTLSEDEYRAALTFVRNVVHPSTEALLIKAQSKSAQAQNNALIQLADQAALSFAAHSLHALIAQHTRRHQR